MPASEEEPGVLAAVWQAIKEWLPVLRRYVMGSGRPDPSAVEAAGPAWTEALDRHVMPALETVVDHAWRWQSGEPFVSASSFAQAQLAITRNLLVRMPDDVYHLIFSQISEGQALGESDEAIAARIDRVLFQTGSEWWQNRAKVIARTEAHRAWQAGRLAAAQYYEPPTGPGWTKTWRADLDGHERPAHRRADGQTRRLTDTFQVGGEDLRFPGDPAGRADNVIQCRCDLDIKKGV